jgi:hypothetical protein
VIDMHETESEISHMKKNHVFVFNIVFGCILVFVCLSCGETKYRLGDKLYSRTELLAMDKKEYDEMLSQISPTNAPVGGSLVVIIPTDEFLVQTIGASNQGVQRDIMRKWSDLQLQLFRNHIIAMVEALRRRALFDTVEWRQSIDPEQEAFEADFALVWPAKKDTEWLLKNRTQTIQEATSIARGPSSLSRLQWMTIWLDNIEVAAKKLKRS